MAAAIPAIVSAVVSEVAAGYIATTALAGTLAGSLLASAAGGLASMALGSAFSPKAKNSSGASGSNPLPLVDAASQRTPQRSTIAYRNIVYGKTKVAGNVLFEKLGSSGTNNRDETKTGRDSYLHQIIAVAGHEIQSFDEIYIDNELLNIDANGWVLNTKFTKTTDTFAAKAATGTSFAYYAPTQATGSGTSASIYIDLAWTTGQNQLKAGDLIEVTGFSDAAYNGRFEITSSATHASGAATRVNYTTDSAISTSPITQPTSSNLRIRSIGYRGTTAYVYDNSGHGLVSGDNVWIYDASPQLFENNKTPVTAVKSTNTFTYALTETPTIGSNTATFQRRNGTDSALVNIQTFLGSDSQNLHDDANIQDLMPDLLQETDAFKGIACIYLRAYDADEFNNAPNISAVIKGKKVYDYRSGAYGWSDNLALCLFDYMTWSNTEHNDAFSLGLNYNNDTQTSDDLELTFWEDAADICDEEVALKVGGTQARYTMNGSLSMADQFIDNIMKILMNCAGTISYVQGKYRLHVSAYDAPTHYVNADWLCDNITINIDNDKQELTNTMNGTFLNEDDQYYPDDVPEYEDADAVTADNDETLRQDPQYPFITNTEYAQRMNKLNLNIKRLKETIELPLNYKGMNLAIWDTLTLDIPELEINREVYRVIAVSASLTDGGLKAIIREENSAIYDWNSSEAA